MTHHLALRVYYEDTDLAGIVYYANYLKFIERGRTEALRAAGIDQMALKAQSGLVFAVRHLACDYLAPARMDDMLVVQTQARGQSGARIVMSQSVWRGETLLFKAEVTLVCIDANGRPTRLPAEIRTHFSSPSDGKETRKGFGSDIAKNQPSDNEERNV